MGEGYAGAAVLNGRVYLMDYDRDKKQDALRCLSLADGREIWRYAYPVSVKRNHGMSRTVPAVTDKLVVAMGPKCHVVCLDPATGELRWGLDLVRQYGTTVPPWYAGQCPLIDNGAVILAPGGKSALLLACDGQTGARPLANPQPARLEDDPLLGDADGVRRPAHVRLLRQQRGGGCLGEGRLHSLGDHRLENQHRHRAVAADSERRADLPQRRLQRRQPDAAASQGRRPPRAAKRSSSWSRKIFGATQHTPILFENHLYGVRADGKFVCLTLEGKPVWASGSGQQFGLGPFMLADGLFFAMNDSGLLRLIEATPEQVYPAGQAQVLKGRESWAPLALAGGRLIARDLTRMVCLDVGRH